MGTGPAPMRAHGATTSTKADSFRRGTGRGLSVAQVRCGRRAGWARRASSRLPVLLVLTALLVQAGCTATVLPPAAVDEPARVAILDHGRHASLVLEQPGGAVVLYTYGDWEWFALRRTGPREASAAVLGPSQAALGKKHLPGPLTAQALVEQVRVLVTDIIVLHVERRRLDELAARLDAVFRANISSLVHNDAYDLDFVHHPEPYSAFHNSNEVVANWLEELGCRVTRPSLFFTWKLDAPAR
jgi:hypothetical protein